MDSELPSDGSKPAPLSERCQTIVDLVVRSGTQAPRSAGIEIDGQFLSYAQILAQSRVVAAHFQRVGIRPGDRICSMIGSRAEVLLTWFGTLFAGAIWVPINNGLTGDDLAYMIKDSGSSAMVVDREFLGKICDPRVRPQLPTRKFLVDRQGEAEFTPFSELLTPGRTLDEVAVGPADPAVIIYTGGTTGLPKGVELPHFAMVAGAMRYQEAFKAEARDRHFSVSPLFHAGGLTIAILGPMMAGMHSTVDRKFSLSGYWDRVRSSGATIINPIGVILTLLCKAAPSPSDTDHRVRVSIGVSSQLPDDISQQFSKRFGVKLVNVYSLSEASGAMIVYNPVDSLVPSANGRPSPWVEIGIVDKADQPLPRGEIGEIVLRPKVPHTFMLRYHNNDAETVKVFRNLWLHTGDLGYLDDKDYLFFKGREAHWLRRRGENISAQEVESILSQFPHIAELAVVGTPSEIGEEEVKVFIVPEHGQLIDPQALIRWCADRMAGFKVPRFVEFVDALPRSTAKSEIERHKLRAMPNDKAWDRERAFGRQIPKSA